LSGLYLHIPFCKQACHYCDFHFSTSTRLKSELVAAICREIALQKDYLDTRTLETVYFGGGTPSLLSPEELSQVMDSIHRHFQLEAGAEITLEANPDDLDSDKLRVLQASGINRLSIGIQSFYEPHLKYLNRAHNAREAQQCVRLAQDAGFENITIDLIYAIPFTDHSVWETDLQTATQLGVPHLSAYCLTIEPQTAFGKWVRTGKMPLVDEEFSVTQFQMLIAHLEAQGYEQYEISNFARPGHYSRHNTNYWRRVPYLGIGPSAHSYNGSSRQSNVANNAQYLKALATDVIPATLESLSIEDQVNEYLMTSLRTQWGCNLSELREWSGVNLLDQHQALIAEYQRRGLLHFRNNILQLTPAGKLLADQIASDLFIV
jgi:oxygen-independent coproporphyrinogen III oxidase